MAHYGAIDPNLLRTFVRVAETGSFTHTAELVGRTQSTISMQVRRLENVLGRSLLSRSKGTKVRLTEAGSRLLTRAQEMLALHDAIWEDFHSTDSVSRASVVQPASNDYALPLKAQREAFTAQVMMTLLTNDKFTKAYAIAMRSVEAQKPIDPVAIGARDDELLMALLSMLEYIAINFLSNTMDREVILRQRKSGLLRVYQVLETYINYKRKIWQRPNAYRSFELLVKNHILDPGEAD